MLFVSCDEFLTVEDCNGVLDGAAIVDDCGICSGGDTGLTPNVAMSCDGLCNNDLIPLWTESMLGNGVCNDGSSLVSLNCEDHNCDNGDCGIWNGDECFGLDGSSVIKYTDPNSIPVDSSAVITNDPSIPENFTWDLYYSVIPGTYTFSYPLHDSTIYEGSYSIFINSGSINNNGDNECFELQFWTYLGPIFSNYSWMSECKDYWQSLNNSDRSFIPEREKININYKIGSKEEIAYQHYISRKAEDDRLRNLYGNTNNINADFKSNATIVNNEFDYNRIMEEITSNPNVIIQQGENFIMKYVRKKIIPH